MTGDWRDSALCGQTDGQLFFPGKGEGTAAPLKVCQACPVRAECLADAMAMQEWHGIGGGMSGEARRKLLVGKRVKPADPVEDILRLRAKKWTTSAISLRLGVDRETVWRVLRAHKEDAA